jgi:tRNA pseudouridine(38-40) synthase
LTVQGDLERALVVVLSSWHKKQRTPLELQAPLPQITGSGRTDAGVHAKAQVVSFNWPEELQGELPRLMAALNGITSPALSVLKLEAVADDFDARHTPHRKVYSYRFVLARNSFGLAYNLSLICRR